MGVFFYDCEFLETGRTIDLISIGVVSLDGREYYAVNEAIETDDTLHRDICRHTWLVRNVVRHLPLRVTRGKPVYHLPDLADRNARFSLGLDDSRVLPLRVIRNQLRDFIAADSPNRADHELWAYYGAYDHVALCQLWGTMFSLPGCVPMFTHELVQLWETTGKPPLPEQTDEHHALADARWDRELWETCQQS